MKGHEALGSEDEYEDEDHETEDDERETPSGIESS
jgi:hypothetical protein